MINKPKRYIRLPLSEFIALMILFTGCAGWLLYFIVRAS